MTNIIITHRGNPAHLKYVLAQLKETNPGANIVLMGDKSNNRYSFVKHAMLSDYFNMADKFSKVYKHLNSTDISYELFCYQRWFCVYEYMKKNNLKDVFSLDSDVLVYDDLTKLNKFLSKYDFAVSAKSLTNKNENPGNWMAGPPLGYFKIETLKSLCDFFTDSYTNKKYTKLFDKKMAYHAKRNEPYGVCDMTQIYFFAKEHQKNMFNLSDIFELDGEKTRIDETILDTSDFVCDDNHKKLLFEGKTVYAFDKKYQNKIRFPLIHFQGYCPVNAKEWIPDYYIGKRYKFCLLKRKIKHIFSKIRWYINKYFYLHNNCKIDSDNIVLLPAKIRFIKKLKIRINGKNNFIDLSKIEKIEHDSIIAINGNNNKISLDSMNIKGHLDITINGNDSYVDSGERVIVDDTLSCFLQNKTGIEIGARTSFFKTSIQSIHEGTKVKIGKDCMFSYDIYLYNSDGHPVCNAAGKVINKPKDLYIGNHVWVSWAACVLKGVSVPDGCIIGRSAVVTKSFKEENCVIAGNPAKICKKLDGTWKRNDVDFLKE